MIIIIIIIIFNILTIQFILFFHSFLLTFSSSILTTQHIFILLITPFIAFSNTFWTQYANQSCYFRTINIFEFVKLSSHLGKAMFSHNLYLLHLFNFFFTLFCSFFFYFSIQRSLQHTSFFTVHFLTVHSNCNSAHLYHHSFAHHLLTSSSSSSSSPIHLPTTINYFSTTTSTAI